MKPIRAMGVRGRALLFLTGALALALAIGGRTSADTCLNSNTWFFQDLGGGIYSVDGAGTVILGNAAASQGIFVRHPVLSGTVRNLNAAQVEVRLLLFDSSNQFVASVWVSTVSSQGATANVAATWPAGSTTNFTIDAFAILAQHFPGIDLSTVANVTLTLIGSGLNGGAVQFSNLCLTDKGLSITTCAPAQTAAVGAGCQAAVPDFTGGVRYGGGSGAVTITQNPAAGTLVGLGEHPITLTAMDAALQSSTCATSFTVVDATPPVITLNGSSPMTVECHTLFSDPGATASEGCAGPAAVTPSGSVDPNTPGTYTLTYTATNSGGTATATRTVQVVDTIQPVITLNGASPMTVECHTGFTDPGATASDACAGSFAATASGSVDSNTPGTYTLTYTAADPSGNAATAVTRTVEVVDSTAPTLTLTDSSSMTVECHGSFTDPGATANDGCAGPVAVTASGSVDVNTPGSYTLTYTAADPSGNAAAPVTRTVHVVDATPPTLTLTGSSSMTVECHGSFTDPGATASDACAGPVAVTISGSVNVDSLGSYTLTYTATDPSGNPQTATRTVNVLDTTPPTVTPPATITQAAAAGQCSALVDAGTATATDTCAGALTPMGIRSDGQALNASYPVGTTTITWTVTDPAGLSAAATETVTVLDQQPPTFSCPGNQSVGATSASGAVVSFTVGATDNCGVASLVCTNPSGQVVTSGSTFPVGPTTVTCTAIDAAGNPSTCSFSVTVVPAADLSLTMSASPGPVVTGSNLTYTIGVTNNGPQPAQGVVLTDPLPAGVSFVSASSSPNAGTLTTPKGGNLTVTWNVGTLASGQSATLTVVVKVNAKAGATINNIASVSSSTVDPNPGNNNATVSALVAKR